ncbi:ATP-dependent DNA helicase [Trichonephila inaurata madagascariensis]|nr:ATP-dependent DNA helicase [Trichonephila inaurata madagascariensis]
MLREASSDFDLDRAIHVYPTHAPNTAVLDRYRAKGEQVFKIDSQDDLINTTKIVDNVNIDSIAPGDINKTGRLQKE